MKDTRKKPDGASIPKSVIKKRAARKKRKKSQQVVLSTIHKSEILDELYPERNSVFKPRQLASKVKKHINLKNFSFIDNPAETIEMFKDIIHADSFYSKYQVNFLDHVCLDMAPYLIFNLIRQDCDKIRMRGGRMSDHVSKVLQDTNLTEHMRIKIIENKRKGVKNPRKKTKNQKPSLNLWSMKLKPCRQSRTDKFSDDSASHGTVATEYRKELDRWLNQVGYSLTETGRKNITYMISEVLNNAILHSNPDMLNNSNEYPSVAWLSGFMTRDEEKETKFQYTCHVSVVNLGDSIYESMQTCSNEVRQQIEGRVNEFLGILSRYKTNWNEETLWTLYAIQDGITRVSGDDKPRGGKGLMDIIDFFSQIADSRESSLVIVSGHAVLTITDPKPKFDEKTGLRALTLNKDDDINLPPDNDYVQLLKKPFPGTILTWRFCLNPDCFEPTKNNKGNKNE